MQQQRPIVQYHKADPEVCDERPNKQMDLSCKVRVRTSRPKTRSSTTWRSVIVTGELGLEASTARAVKRGPVAAVLEQPSEERRLVGHDLDVDRLHHGRDLIRHDGDSFIVEDESSVAVGDVSH
ncbi:uncharacterized protein A4U43_C05F28690 [Asparagus officinalis]|uniref:Uncharacterized protein n=1 Tax=Asparagus officinalis TaxID=4686 RepID=A0A5P1EVT9_ASPOF|nr:uncharacterized protein A4U43_C05F28690 [Asparagus officinalis]